MNMRSISSWLLAGLLPVALTLAGCGSDSPEALVAAGKNSLAKNDGKAAVIQFKNALQKKPDLPEARYLLGRALLEAGAYAEAEVELRKARELKHPADLVLPQLMLARLALGQYAKVIEEVPTAGVITPAARADLNAVLAAAYLAQGKSAEAQAAVTAALKDDPTHVPALLTLAQIKGAAKDFAGAMKAVDDALAKAPTDVRAMNLKAALLSVSGQRDAAIAQYRKLLEIQNDFLAAHAELSALLMGAGKVQEAKAQIEAMAKVAPNHPATLLNRLMYAIGVRDYQGARVISQQLLKVAPNYPFALQLAGTVEYQLRSHVQAKAYLDQAVQFAPDSIAARRWLAMNELAMGKPARALAALAPVFGRIENDSAMLALAGEIYMHLGEVKKGAAAYAKAVKLDPKNVGTRTADALARYVTGDAEGALKDLARISAEDPGTAADKLLVATHLLRGEIDKALKVLDVMEKKAPNDPTVFNWRGRVQMFKGDSAGARKSFERSLAISPAFYTAAASLAALDIADKKPEEARKRFENLIAADPKNTDALVALAAMKSQTRASADEVVGLLKKSIDIDPFAVSPRVALVAYYLSTKEAKKAVGVAQDALAAIPDRPELLDALGRAQQAAGEVNQALATYAKLATKVEGSAEPYLRMAQIQAANRDTDGAARSLRKALEVKPDLVAAQQALIAFELGKDKPTDALAIAREVQKQRPNEAIGYLLEGTIGAASKSWGQAIDAYRAGLKRNPGSTELAIGLYASLTETGRKAEADRFAVEWIKENPKDVGLRFGLGDRARDRGDYAAAAGYYRAVLDLAPDNAILLNNLAWVAGRLKDPNAIAYAEKSNKLAPDQPALMDTLAMLLAEKGETQRALDLLGKAVRGAPNVPAIRLNYARVLVQAGKKTEARNELQELAKLGDKFPQQAEVAKLSSDL